MTEVLAGASGAKERRYERARALSAAFLADMQNLQVQIAAFTSNLRKEIGILEVLQAYETAARSGAELALLTSPASSTPIRNVLSQAYDLVFLSADESGTLDKARASLQTDLAKVTDALYSEFGTRQRKLLSKHDTES